MRTGWARMSGQGADTSKSKSVAIHLENAKGVRIKDTTVAGFDVGVESIDSEVEIEGLRTMDTGHAIEVTNRETADDRVASTTRVGPAPEPSRRRVFSGWNRPTRGTAAETPAQSDRDGRAKKAISAAEQALGLARRGLGQLRAGDDDLAIAGLSNVAIYGKIVTARLQTMKGHVPEFDDWYAPWKAQVAADELSRYFWDLRVQIEHQLPPEPVKVGFIAAHFSTKDTIQMTAARPSGADTLFVGDADGQSGWIVRLEDGTVEKWYVRLPDTVLVWALHALPDLPSTHLGQPIENAALQDVAALYVNYLAEIVADARVKLSPVAR